MIMLEKCNPHRNQPCQDAITLDFYEYHENRNIIMLSATWELQSRLHIKSHTYTYIIDSNRD